MTAPQQLPGGRARPSRRPLWVLALIVGLPILEIALLIVIGRWLGVWQTIAIVLLVGVLGLALLVYEGPKAWRNLRGAATGTTSTADGATVRSGPQLPTRELSDGAIVAVGALLLLLPGFLTDLLALGCLLPATRPLLRRALGAAVRRKTDQAAARWRGRVQGPVAGHVVVTPDDERPPHPGGGATVEGKIIEPGREDRPRP